MINQFIVKYFKYLPTLFDEKLSSTEGFAVYYFTFSAIFLVIRVYAELFLLQMALKMQELFRAHGHVKNKKPRLFIFLCYFIYCGSLVYQYIFKPSVLLRINTSDYECSYPIKLLFSFSLSWAMIAWPLSFQISFIGMIWQLSRIDKEALAVSEHMTFSIGSSVNDLRDMSLASPA